MHRLKFEFPNTCYICVTFSGADRDQFLCKALADILTLVCPSDSISLVTSCMAKTTCLNFKSMADVSTSELARSESPVSNISLSRAQAETGKSNIDQSYTPAEGASLVLEDGVSTSPKRKRFSHEQFHAQLR